MNPQYAHDFPIPNIDFNSILPMLIVTITGLVALLVEISWCGRHAPLGKRAPHHLNQSLAIPILSMLPIRYPCGAPIGCRPRNDQRTAIPKPLFRHPF